MTRRGVTGLMVGNGGKYPGDSRIVGLNSGW